MKKLARIVVALAVASVATSASARPCTTVNVLAAKRGGHGAFLTAAVQPRPFDVALFADSANYPVRVHYQDEAQAASAAEILTILEDAWARQVVEQGFDPPLADDGLGGSDALDVYLANPGNGVDALTLADDDVDDSDGRHAAPVHIQLNPNALSLESRVHHEFQHALHFAIDASESLMWFEATAVFQEWLKDPEGSAWSEELPAFQQYPQAPPFTNGIDWRPVVADDVLYEYGAVLYVLYLEQAYGELDGQLVRRLWQGSIQSDDVEENEPDWMDALASEFGTSVHANTLDFASWRMLVAGYSVEGQGPPGADALGGDTVVGTRSLLIDTLDGSPLQNTDGAGAPHQDGCAVFSMSASDIEPLELEVQVQSLMDSLRPFGVAYAVFDSDAVERTSFELLEGAHTRTIEVAPSARLNLAVCDLSESDADALPQAHPIEVRLWNTAVPRADDDDAGTTEPEEDAGTDVDGGSERPPLPCSCQSTGGGGGLPDGGPFGKAKKVVFPLMLVGGMLSLIYRGRRAMKRRKSYRGAYKKEESPE